MTVYLDGEPTDELLPLVAYRGAGGRRLDRCTLALRRYSPLVNADLSLWAASEIEVRIRWFWGEEVVHWGRLSVNSLEIGRDEYQTWTSRLEPFHFGGVLLGMTVYDPISSAATVWHEQLVFNPRIDGQVFGNRSQLAPASPAFCFLDPESARTAAALAVQAVTAVEKWTLPLAIDYLCWDLNPLETHVTNPRVPELAVLPASEDLLADVRLPHGLTLPECLDRLLEPFGFSWQVTLEPRRRRITFFEGGQGPQKAIYLGPPGSVLGQDNAEQIQLDRNVGSVRNRVTVLGDWQYFEGTFELVRAWDDADDALEADANLDKDSANYASMLAYRRVWREWVLNEAGDYVGLRPEITAPYDLSTFFEHAVVPRRRKFLPTLAHGEDRAPAGDVGGCHVELSVDGGSTWYPYDQAKHGAVHLLERECGLRFDGQRPPDELMAAGSSAKVRITATLRDDQRLLASAGPDNTSPLAAAATELVDAGDRFHRRDIDSTSSFFGDVASGARTSSIGDDSAALANYTARLKRAWDMADLGGRVLLEGLENGGPYLVGDVIDRVDDRQIFLGAHGAGEERYPQVIGIEYDFQRHKRTLLVETYRLQASAEAGG